MTLTLKVVIVKVQTLIIYIYSKLNLLFIYHILEAKQWFQPECTGSGSDGHVGPSSRAFHVAVAIDCHMFIFGGRLGSQRFVLHLGVLFLS